MPLTSASRLHDARRQRRLQPDAFEAAGWIQRSDVRNHPSVHQPGVRPRNLSPRFLCQGSESGEVFWLTRFDSGYPFLDHDT